MGPKKKQKNDSQQQTLSAFIIGSAASECEESATAAVTDQTPDSTSTSSKSKVRKFNNLTMNGRSYIAGWSTIFVIKCIVCCGLPLSLVSTSLVKVGGRSDYHCLLWQFTKYWKCLLIRHNKELLYCFHTVNSYLITIKNSMAWIWKKRLMYHE